MESGIKKGKIKKKAGTKVKEKVRYKNNVNIF
jgi:hypothetical protein